MDRVELSPERAEALDLWLITAVIEARARQGRVMIESEQDGRVLHVGVIWGGMTTKERWF